jgi:hypothetical protein
MNLFGYCSCPIDYFILKKTSSLLSHLRWTSATWWSFRRPQIFDGFGILCNPGLRRFRRRPRWGAESALLVEAKYKDINQGTVCFWGKSRGERKNWIRRDQKQSKQREGWDSLRLHHYQASSFLAFFTSILISVAYRCITYIFVGFPGVSLSLSLCVFWNGLWTEWIG